jgi:peptide/nickel transport system permease protein
MTLTELGAEAVDAEFSSRPTPRAPRRRPRVRWRVVLPAVVVALALLAAFFPALFTPVGPELAVPSERLLPPSWAHPFGTDQIGRDLYSRVIYGAAASLGSAAIAVALAVILGSLIGLLSGFLGGWVDAVLMRIVEVILAIPSLLLALAVVSALGFGTVNVAIAVGLVATAAFARLMRSEVLRVRDASFIEAARSGGIRRLRILGTHVLPNSWGTVLALSTLEFGHALLAISTLSFLGFGTPPPAPEWGSLVSAGRGFLATAWWMSAMPGLVIAIVVLAMNSLGHNLDRSNDD